MRLTAYSIRVGSRRCCRSMFNRAIILCCFCVRLIRKILVVTKSRICVPVEPGRLVSLLRPPPFFLNQMVAVVPVGLYPVSIGRISPVVKVVSEQCRAALAEVPELDFLDIDLHSVFRPVPVYGYAEVRLVEEVRRAADVIQRRGFDYSVLVLWHLRRMRHKDYEDIVHLREVRQFVEQTGDILRLVLAVALVFKPVVRVNDKCLDAAPPDEELCPVKDSVKPVVVVRGDEEKIRFEVFLYLPVLPECEVLLVELFPVNFSINLEAW